jgi:hypothetical protein
MRHQHNGPPKCEGRAPQDPADAKMVHQTNYTSSQHSGQPRSLRSHSPICSRLTDEKITAAYQSAAEHLLGRSLLPYPDHDGLQLMWRRGGNSARAAHRIASAWVGGPRQ